VLSTFTYIYLHLVTIAEPDNLAKKINEIKIFEGQLRVTKFTAGRRAKMSFNENNYIFKIKRKKSVKYSPYNTQLL